MSIIQILKWLHWVGLAMVLAGTVSYLYSDLAQDVTGMVTIASLIGIGLVAMSPFPVVLFIQWAKAQPTNKSSEKDNHS